MHRVPLDHRVLVVGVDEPTQVTLDAAFARVGVEADYVASAAEALSVYARSPIAELAFVNLILQDGDGPTLLESFRRHRPVLASVPVVVALSHGGAGELGKRALAAGAIAVLKKPLVGHEVDLALRSALRTVQKKRSTRAASQRRRT